MPETLGNPESIAELTRGFLLQKKTAIRPELNDLGIEESTVPNFVD